MFSYYPNMKKLMIDKLLIILSRLENKKQKLKNLFERYFPEYILDNEVHSFLFIKDIEKDKVSSERIQNFVNDYTNKI